MEDDFEHIPIYKITWEAGKIAFNSGDSLPAVEWLIAREEIIGLAKEIHLNSKEIVGIVNELIGIFNSSEKEEYWSLGNGLHLNVEMGDVPELVLVQTPTPKDCFDYHKFLNKLDAGKIEYCEELLGEGVDYMEYEMADLNHSYFEDVFDEEWEESGEEWNSLLCLQGGILAIAGALYVRSKDQPFVFTTTESGEILGNCFMNDAMRELITND